MTTWQCFKYEYRWARYNYGMVKSFFRALYRATLPLPF